MKKPGGLLCFSPPVMLATFAIETVLLVYSVWRYKLNNIGRLVALILFFLAAFQLAEFNVCAAGWIDPMWASRLGYVAITMLPPLGIHLAYELGKAKKRPFVMPSYILAAGFVAFFLVPGVGLSGNACLGNYAIFQMMPGSAALYTVYYYGLLLLGLWLCWHYTNSETRRPLLALAAGYAGFMLPTTIINLMDRSTIAGIPSIMCGFAVILALVLALYVMPMAGKKRNKLEA